MEGANIVEYKESLTRINFTGCAIGVTIRGIERDIGKHGSKSSRAAYIYFHKKKRPSVTSPHSLHLWFK